MNCLSFLTDLLKGYNRTSCEMKADTTFEQMGMNSYDIVDFLMDVEERCGFVIDDDEMLAVSSIQDVMNTMNKSMQEDI